MTILAAPLVLLVTSRHGLALSPDSSNYTFMAGGTPGPSCVMVYTSQVTAWLPPLCPLLSVVEVQNIEIFRIGVICPITGD